MRSFPIYLLPFFFLLDNSNLVILSFVRNEFELLEEIDFQTNQYECFKKPATEESTVSASIETPP